MKPPAILKSRLTVLCIVRIRGEKLENGKDNKQG